MKDWLTDKKELRDTQRTGFLVASSYQWSTAGSVLKPFMSVQHVNHQGTKLQSCPNWGERNSWRPIAKPIKITLIISASGLNSKCLSKLTNIEFHFGSRSINYNIMHGKPVKIVAEESDLVVIISSSLKYSMHSMKTHNKDNAFFGVISGNFECKAK